MRKMGEKGKVKSRMSTYCSTEQSKSVGYKEAWSERAADRFAAPCGRIPKQAVERLSLTIENSRFIPWACWSLDYAYCWVVFGWWAERKAFVYLWRIKARDLVVFDRMVGAY